MNFTLDPYVATYLNQNSQIIDKEDFEELYKNFLDPSVPAEETSNMTAALYIAGIDPLERSNKVFSHMFYSFPSGILPSSYKIPHQIQRIEESAFRYSMFEELIFPQALTNIDANSCLGMKALKRVVFSPYSKIEYIGDGAFLALKNLQNFIMPKSCKKIGDGAFWQCAGLDTHLKLPEDLQIVGRSAFLGTQIETVEFGPNLKAISQQPFVGCENLKEIIIPRASFNRLRGNVEKRLTVGNNAKVIVV